MKVLLVYYSFTDQAHQAAMSIQDELQKSDITVDLGRIDFAEKAERPKRPLGKETLLALGNMAQKGETVPVVVDPPLVSGSDYQLVVLLSNTWKWHPAVPIQSLFVEPLFTEILKNKPVAIGIVCRGFWKNNLKIMRKLVQGAAGNIIEEDHFTHKGSWLHSSIQNVLFMTSSGREKRRLGILPLPPFGLSPHSIDKVRAFAGRIATYVQSSK